MVMQMIDEISITESQPAMLLPLVCVIIASMAKDAWEDYQRYKEDRIGNDEIAEVYDPINSEF
jgi:hypothetical protein